MPRKYEAIWKAIQVAPFGEWVTVRIHRDAKQRLIQAVRKEKSEQVAPLKMVDLPTEGRLLTKVTPDPRDGHFVLIGFRLRCNEKDI